MAVGNESVRTTIKIERWQLNELKMRAVRMGVDSVSAVLRGILNDTFPSAFEERLASLRQKQKEDNS